MVCFVKSPVTLQMSFLATSEEAERFCFNFCWHNNGPVAKKSYLHRATASGFELTGGWFPVAGDQRRADTKGLASLIIRWCVKATNPAKMTIMYCNCADIMDSWERSVRISCAELRPEHPVHMFEYPEVSVAVDLARMGVCTFSGGFHLRVCSLSRLQPCFFASQVHFAFFAGLRLEMHKT